LFVIAERAAFKEGVKVNPFAHARPTVKTKTAADFPIEEKARWFRGNN
jgi:acyl-[acyl carrier protein]--UDP-N-acetylglucosamine O-acyltransferase